MKLRYPDLQFGALTERTITNMIVIHHTGERDIDASAEQIHNWHLNNGWSGIGYHFVIRKDGTIEVARPEWAVGSHAYGENYHTIGIHLSGDFESATPTVEQIESCAALVADLCRDYNITIDRDHIVGHCDLMSTDCPGKNLYSRLPDIIARANNVAEPQYSVTPEGAPVINIFDLVHRYGANDDCAAVGHGYGLYQFTRSTVDKFIAWLKNYPDDKLANYGRHLDGAKNFDGEWQMLGTVDPGHFTQLQDEFAFEYFYRAATLLFGKENFHVDNHSVALQAVVFVRAVQYGAFGCVELFKRACPYPNLSYVDDMCFDRQLIAAVYDYLIEHPDFGRACGKLNETLRNRFRREKADALC